MDIKTIDHLCDLSKLNFTDNEKEKMIGEMADIISLMDTVKEAELSYDDRLDNNSIPYSDVRKDEAGRSLETEKLLSNTVSVNDCYVVPKVVD